MTPDAIKIGHTYRFANDFKRKVLRFDEDHVFCLSNGKHWHGTVSIPLDQFADRAIEDVTENGDRRNTNGHV